MTVQKGRVKNNRLVRLLNSNFHNKDVRIKLSYESHPIDLSKIESK